MCLLLQVDFFFVIDIQIYHLCEQRDICKPAEKKKKTNQKHSGNSSGLDSGPLVDSLNLTPALTLVDSEVNIRKEVSFC